MPRRFDGKTFLLEAVRIPRPFRAGMNGRIINSAPGGALISNKVFPVPRLIPRRGNPRVPLRAGIWTRQILFLCYKNKSQNQNKVERTENVRKRNYRGAQKVARR